MFSNLVGIFFGLFKFIRLDVGMCSGKKTFNCNLGHQHKHHQIQLCLTNDDHLATRQSANKGSMERAAVYRSIAEA